MEKKAANGGVGWGKVCFLPEPWVGGSGHVPHSKARAPRRGPAAHSFFQKALYVYTFV